MLRGYHRFLGPPQIPKFDDSDEGEYDPYDKKTSGCSFKELMRTSSSEDDDFGGAGLKKKNKSKKNIKATAQEATAVSHSEDEATNSKCSEDESEETQNNVKKNKKKKNKGKQKKFVQATNDELAGTSNYKEETDQIKNDKKSKKSKKSNRQKRNQGDEFPEELGDVGKLADLSGMRNELNDISELASETENPMTINLKNVHPFNEEIRRFGQSVVLEEEGMRYLPRVNRANLSRRMIPRNNEFEEQKPDGISMSMYRQENEIMYFQYDFNETYQGIERHALNIITSNQPNLQILLKSVTNNLISMLEVANVLRTSDRFTESRKLIDNIIYVLESVAHPKWSIASLNCRLDYTIRENRIFHIALLKRLQAVSEKACHKTAIEIAKISLNLDPSDPLGILLIIDSEVHLAKEYAWFVKAVEHWKKEKDVLKLPNIAYSYALCLYYCAVKIKDPIMMEMANEKLQNALLRFPLFITKFIEKKYMRFDQRTTEHEYFKNFADATTPKPLATVISLSYLRCAMFWRENKVPAWLQTNIHKVLDKFENDGTSAGMKAYVNERSSLYCKLPDSVKRHLIVLNIQEIPIPPDPSHENQNPMEVDPYPPVAGIDRYGFYRQESLSLGSEASQNAFTALWSTLLPGL